LAYHLQVNLTSSFVPATNDVFTFLTGEARNGSFSTFTYPSNFSGMELGYTVISSFVKTTKPPKLQLQQPCHHRSGNCFQCTFSGVPGATYVIEFF
jgi:hypothetical protein